MAPRMAWTTGRRWVVCSFSMCIMRTALACFALSCLLCLLSPVRSRTLGVEIGVNLALFELSVGCPKTASAASRISRPIPSSRPRQQQPLLFEIGIMIVDRDSKESRQRTELSPLNLIFKLLVSGRP